MSVNMKIRNTMDRSNSEKDWNKAVKVFRENKALREKKNI